MSDSLKKKLNYFKNSLVTEENNECADFKMCCLYMTVGYSIYFKQKISTESQINFL